MPKLVRKRYSDKYENAKKQNYLIPDKLRRQCEQEIAETTNHNNQILKKYMMRLKGQKLIKI